MSTPIEIVREMQLWRRGQGKYGLDEYPGGMPYSPRQYGEALDAVLADAERFKALELAHGKDEMWISITDGLVGPRGRWFSYSGTLAELADRLREGSR